MRFEPLPQEQPRAMHARLHVENGEAEGIADFLVRESLDVAQQHHRAVVGGQLLDGGAERHPELGLASRVIHAHRPVGNRSCVPPSVNTGSTSSSEESTFGRDRVDALGRLATIVDPGAERGVSAKRIDLPDH